jgi:hypothetical protein
MLPLDAKEVLAAGPAFHFTKRKDAIDTSVAAVKDMRSGSTISDSRMSGISA